MQYNPNIHHRKSLRLKYYNYASEGIYFITICTKNRENLFWSNDKNNNCRGIWQRNYYEHVIRNEKEYYEIVNYIQNNPINWKEDKYYI